MKRTKVMADKEYFRKALKPLGLKTSGEAIRWIKKAETYLRDNKILTDNKAWFSDDEIIAIYGEEEK